MAKNHRPIVCEKDEMFLFRQIVVREVDASAGFTDKVLWRLGVGVSSCSYLTSRELKPLNKGLRSCFSPRNFLRNVVKGMSSLIS